MKNILCAALLSLGLSSFAHAQEHAAVTTINSLYQQIYAAIPVADAASKQSAYCNIAANGLDFPALGKGLVGRYYTEATAEHQAHFNRAMQRVFVSMFSQHFATLNTSRSPEINPQVINRSGGQVQVQTRAPYDANEFTNINFIMRQDGSGNWRIADAIVSGVSLISQKYPEFKAGIDGYKVKYLDPLDRYATEMESIYPACSAQ